MLYYKLSIKTQSKKGLCFFLLSLLHNIKKYKEMSITIADSTNDIVVSFLNDKGTPNIETVTIPATGEYGSDLLAVPATAAAAQGDFAILYSKELNKTAAVWLDINANGTPPTSLVYLSADYKVEVNIITGGTAIANAALFVAALALETGFTGVTVVDHLDGSISFIQDVVGDVSQGFGTANSNNSGAGSFVLTIAGGGLAGITQGDYIVLSNTSGDTIAVWFDVDDDGTEPTGAAYGAADDTLMISISTGDTTIENATNTYSALAADAWSELMVLTDNLNGTIKVATSIGVVVTAADPHNADDTTLGAITFVSTQTGAATKITRVDYLPKEGLKVVQYPRDGYLYLVTQEGHTSRTTPDGRYKYSDIIYPTTANLAALVAQVIAWKNTGGGASVDLVLNEAAKSAEMTGLNDTFTTTYPFVAESIEVFFNQLKMTLNVDYTEDGAAGEIIFASITPDDTLPEPDTLTFNYLKL